MADDTKSRRKKKEPERINLDDWANAGALDGLLSFLNITPEQAPVNQGQKKVLNLLESRGQAPALDDRLKEALPDIDTVSISGTLPDTDTPAKPPAPLPDIDTVSIRGTLPDTDRPRTSPPPAPAAPTPNDVFSHPKQATGFGNKKLYRCLLAQDGHSHTEEALYQILWRSGKPESEDTRLTTMGYGEMAGRVRLSFNNTKSACQRLTGKLAIEEVAREISDLRVGKTYRVYSYRAILERRKSCGMEWVIRNKGVEFVTPTTAPPPSISGSLPVIDTVSETGREALSVSGRGTGSITGTLLENSFREITREEESSSSAPERSALVEALAEYGQPDDDVAHALLQRCRAAVPDCTVEEVIHFVRQKGSLVRQDRSGRIANAMGFLLTAVPKCFSGESFGQYREQQRRSREEEQAMRDRQQAEIEQWRREQEAVLADPLATEEEKRFARETLGMK
jgi:hypothetical protein